MENILSYILLSAFILSPAIIYTWLIHKSKNAYVEKDTGVVYYLVGTTYADTEEALSTQIYILQSSKDGGIIRISKDYLNKHFI